MRHREGGLRRGEYFWLCLTTASAQCLRLCERFLIISRLPERHKPIELATKKQQKEECKK